jgi:hypothetical protein
MPMSSRHILATSVSQGVVALLAAAPATVHSVFARALNLEVRGELLTLADERAGRLPNGVALQDPPDFRALGLRAGDRADLGRQGIRVPSAGLAIDLSGARPWNPGLASLRGRADPGRFRLFGDLGQASGFGARAADPWRAWHAIDALHGALGAGDLAAMLGAAGALIGRGPGLTPSGDDFLLGFAAALTATGHPLGRPFARGVAERARGATTDVARAYLDHAASGEYAEHLHTVMRALLVGSDGDLAIAVGRALGWGATSGADALTGIAVAIGWVDGAMLEVAA